MAPRPIIIDCDPGADDAVALLLALASQDELDLIGVTTVAGNVPLGLTSANARRVCELAGRGDIPVYAGCPGPILLPLATAEHVHGETGLDGAGLPPPVMPVQQRHAVEFIIDSVGAWDGALTLCAMGPLTNLAIAIIQRPDIVPHIREIVLMGGAVGAGNVTPVAEFNIHVDPHAAQIVFAAGAPLTMIGLDCTRQALVTAARLEALRAIGGPTSDAVTGLLEHYHGANIDRLGGDGAPLHDPCVIGYLLRPDLFAGRDAHVTVETADEETIGRTAVDFSGAKINARVIETVDADGFFDLLTERLARL